MHGESERPDAGTSPARTSWRGPADFVRQVKLEAHGQKSAKHPRQCSDGDEADEREETGASDLYEEIPSTVQFAVSPSVVHFGGYKAGQDHVVKIRVTNTSNDTIRVRVQQPQTASFSASYRPRASLPPGLSEVVKLSFRPDEWKYYRDNLVVFSENARLEVPIHAYPVVNRVDVPRMLDFGVCELAKTHRRVLKLACKVPMAFDFEVVELASNPDFHMMPLSGQIPANGAAELTVEYTPHHLKVSSFSFRLRVDQYGFEPIVCTVTGSSQPGLTRSAALKHEEKLYHEELDAQFGNQTSPRVLESLKQVRFGTYGDATVALKKRTAHYDPGGAVLYDSEKTRAQSNQDELDRSAGEDDHETDPGMVVIEGIRFPRRLEGVQATNYCLTQAQDKLKPKDLKAAINKQRRARELEKRTKDLALKKFGGPARTDPVQRILNDDRRASDASTTAQVKEMVFMQRVLEIEENERSREFASQAVFIGENRLEAAQVDAINAERVRAAQAADLAKREEERRGFGSRCLGPTSIPPTRVTAQPERSGSGENLESAENQEANFEQPTFDAFANDEWRKRKAVTVRFIGIIGKILVRKRAQKRLDAIWKRLGSARTRKAVRALVEEDHIRAKLAIGLTTSNGAGKGGHEGDAEPSWMKHRRAIMKKPANQLRPLGTQARLAKLSDSQASLPEAADPGSPEALAQASETSLPPPDQGPRGSDTGPETEPTVSCGKIMRVALKATSQLHLVSFPQLNDSTVFDAKPVATTPVQGFQDLGFFKLRAPEEYKLCGYEKFEYPALTQYLPRCDDMELRQGAEEESCWRSQENVIPEDALAAEMPAAWRKPRTLPGLELLLPDRQQRVFEDGTKAVSEADLEFTLQARPVKLPDPQTRGEAEAWTVGVSGSRALTMEPTISDRFRPMRTLLGQKKSSLWALDDQGRALLQGPREEDELSDDEDEDDEELKARETQIQGQLDAEGGGELAACDSEDAPSQGLGNDAAGAISFEDVERIFFADSASAAENDEQDEPANGAEVVAAGGALEDKRYADVAYHRDLLEAEIEASRREKFARLERHLQQCTDSVRDPLLRFSVRDLR